MAIADEARAVQDRAIRRSDRAANAALAAWRRVDGSALGASWDAVVPRVEAVVAEAVRGNAASAGRFTSAVAAADGMTGDVLVPEAFTGVDGSGRSMRSLLHGAVTTTKQAIGAGMSIPDALITGGSYLTLMLKTAVADVERSSSMAAAAGKGYVRYVRLVNPGACSRCAILAGSDRYRSSFQRHPACRCSTVPVRGTDFPDGLFTSPEEYFGSLSRSEQDRVFTPAGAEAIRLGASPISVVNARRGAKRMTPTPGFSPSRLQRSVIGRRPDGSPVMGYTTVEATTRRGSFGRRQRSLGAAEQRLAGSRYSSSTRPRLMPESIIELTDDVEMRRLLLRDAGYLEPPIVNLADTRAITNRAAQQARDKAAADAFYRSKGITVT